MRICGGGLAALVAAAAVALAAEPAPVMKEEGPFVRVMRNQDGSRTEFRRTPDNRTLTKKTFTPQGNLQSVTVYRMDAQGNPRSCKIYDGQNQELFKVAYGYDRQFGRLIEEQMFDSRAPRIDHNTGKEMPVRRFRYVYDAQGNRSRPISVVLTPGRKADDVYPVGPSALERNPFDDDKEKPANPRARPLRR
jgi:hypothetical protein